jgi:hypothetical protein
MFQSTKRVFLDFAGHLPLNASGFLLPPFSCLRRAFTYTHPAPDGT